MGKYIVRRIFQMIIVLIGISLISFSIMQLAPGDPIDLLADRNSTPAEKAHIRSLYGLDKPLLVQYYNWISQVLRGNFGTSFITGQPVLKMIMDRLPATLWLNFWAMILIYLLAIPIGMLSALKQYSWFDQIVTTIAFLGKALPQFWFALMLIYLVGMRFDFIEISRMSTYGVTIAKSGFLAVVVDRLKYMILPLTVLTFSGMAGIARYMRASMLDVKHQDYIRTARAKGLSEKQVVTKHAFKNSLLPIVTLIGFELPIMFSGSVVIETIFSWPGIGLLAVNSIFQRDYMVVMAFNMLGAVMTVLGMFLADLLYVVVDPRIKLK
ncbi:ABC transporter permease [Clostridium sp. 'deep sea']|uniref:ABC transporter permease n=1 Tax=Clostridium sp. 'deep sea' TaxID=2779445 RepID=UPI0018964CE6|nr:ABC transporter permease [Clostridium sp. 'deep sea']QOR34368.1 ABC transporter permease [Clostridium sp. 'deep sea']